MKDINYLFDVNDVKPGEKVNPIYILGARDTIFLEKRKKSFIGGEKLEESIMITEFTPGSSGKITMASHYHKASNRFPEYNAFANQLNKLLTDIK